MDTGQRRIAELTAAGRDPEGDWMQTRLGVARDARVDHIRFLRLGFGLNLELFEYTAVDQVRVQPRNSDIGGFHLFAP